VNTNDGQCHGDRQNGEAPPKRGGMKAESRQLGTEKQKRSTLDFGQVQSFPHYDD